MEAFPETSRAAGCDLEAVIATEELDTRTSRFPEDRAETAVLLRLTRELAVAPEEFFERLVEAILQLARADSAGISLLNEQQNCFVWPAVSGGLKPYVREGTPRDFGPCGTVLERNKSLLMVHPERHYLYLAPIMPPLEEVLLIPFYMDGKAVGTIWAVMHEPNRRFDREDKRLLESLGVFAALAYGTLARTGQLRPFLQPKVSRTE